MTRPRPAVALDGPAGAGKSTVARLTARALGFTLVDTGALYRTVALAAQRAGIPWSNTEGVASQARRLAEGALQMRPNPEGAVCVLLDGEDVSSQIRTPEMSFGASQVSSIPEVRAALLAMQRGAASEGGVVLEGRDIGTVVLPDAEAKFFVTASPEVRARRRHEELLARGFPSSFEQTLAEVLQRDEADSNRSVSPLRAAEDAELVDTSAMTIEEVVARIVQRVRQITGAR
ncbi:MAG: (d)CMP kinase [Myxococcales bacterium]|nr:(d)CMP kinase [Polyangiaceae bacterium]MDW8249260.1 (d)CMP kinase [Myxococcales bacterium]